jgi:predicted aconitase with swiveling domain
VTEGVILAGGTAEGELVVLTEPLSFWGGYDPAAGVIVDARHPQRGVSLAGTVVLMPGGRGSSSSSAVLAEAIRAGTSPAGIVLRDADTIVALGAIVAEELYGRRCPVVVVDAAAYGVLASAGRLRVDAEGDAEAARVSATG